MTTPSNTASYTATASPTSTSIQVSPRRSRLSNSSTKVLGNSAEDEVLDQITKEAEARLASRRQARAEAREIRLRELERQQKAMEETSDRHYDLMSGGGGVATSTPVNGGGDYSHRISNYNRTTPLLSRESRTASFASSRRSSQESLDCAGNDSARELRHHMHELEEKFRQAMINNAQLDNEKQSHVYQLDLYKDNMEEMEENYIRVQRDLKDKNKNYESVKRELNELKQNFTLYKDALEERDRLIYDAGLVLIRNDDQKLTLCSQSKLNGTLTNGDVNGETMVNGTNGNLDDEDEEVSGEAEDLPLLLVNNLSLISKNAAQMIVDVGGKTLEAKLGNLLAERLALNHRIKELTDELEEERQRYNELNDSFANNSHHLNSEVQAEIQREANKITNDLRYKLKKSETEVATLTASVSRLETQLSRYKQAAEESERLEDELKTDKRKAQRELREALTRIEELQSANTHLQKRIDKLKSNRNLFAMLGNSNPSTPPIGDGGGSGPESGSGPNFPNNTE